MFDIANSNEKSLIPNIVSQLPRLDGLIGTYRVHKSETDRSRGS